MSSPTRTEVHRSTDPASAFRVIETRGPADSKFPTFVLIHGLGTSHRYLSRLHQAMATKADVISVELPGFAGLPKPPEDLTVSQMTAVLADVCASFSSRPTVLVGHSMGSQWAVELALQHPELVSRVVMIGPVTDDQHRSLLAQSRALALDSLGESPLLNWILVTDYFRCGVPWYLTQVRHMLTYPTEEKVDLLTAPLLVIRGGRDPVAGRAWCRKLSKRAASGSLVEIPGHGHAAQHAAPKAVASAIFHYVAVDGSP